MLAAVVVSAVDEPSRVERSASEGGRETGSADGRGPGWLIAGCLAVLTVPFVVALVGFRRPTWTPVLDLAMTELRVRDVGGRHTPLIGLPGRIGTLAEQGSHPGPLSFYALAPAYRLLGSSAWALQVAAALVHVVAMGVALVLAGRRGGRPLVLVVGAGLAVLTAGYGGGALTEPWNPYLPLIWWVVALLAVWSVLCGDLAMLPVAVLAGSFCAQTHVPYLGLTLGIGALAAAAAAITWFRARSRRREVVRWVLVSLAVGAVLWLPPTIDQLRHDPGNYRTLIEHFSSPDEEPKGLGDGIEVGLRYLDLAHLARADVTDPGWLVTSADGNRPVSSRGTVLLAVWAASAVVGLRRGSASLRALHLLVGAAVVLMVLAISRIFGVVWYYLTLWGWAIGLLALGATVATVLQVWHERGAGPKPAVTRVGLGVVAALGLAVAARFTVDAWSSPHADGSVAAQLARAVGDVADGLDRGEGLATGDDGRYLVTWSDPLHIGSQGFGLLNELERRGFDVGVETSKRAPATPHRVFAPGEATARVHLVTGSLVERWDEVPGAVRIAFVDTRDDAARREQDALRAEVTSTLRSLGLEELIEQLDTNLFGTAIDQRIPEATQQQLGRVLDLGGPLAVYVIPVDTPEP